VPTPNDVFSEIDERLKADPEKLTGTTAKYLFDLSGDNAGEYHIDIHNGAGDAGPGHIDNPNITITMNSRDFVNLATGKLGGATAFMSGKIKIQGDMELAMKLQSLLE
jgi:putative sterol carrier protein